jgi:hypothetical protein
MSMARFDDIVAYVGEAEILCDSCGTSADDPIFAGSEKADILTRNAGSVITLTGLSNAGREWLMEHVSPEEIIYCDHREGIDILEGALDDGLTLEDASTGALASR